ncbi:hypothetical protein NMG60_11006033 [Bertholletia excelsa]
MQIEEVGWKHLLRLGEDLTDEKGRLHMLEILLDEFYPRSPPAVSADTPYMFDLVWSIKSGLRDVVNQFQQHLGKLQELWSMLDKNDCFLTLSIDAIDPRYLPECRFICSSKVAFFERIGEETGENQPLPANLANILEYQLPRQPYIHKKDQQIECGISCAQCLPIDDELGAESGSGTNYTCHNGNCSRAFHTSFFWIGSVPSAQQGRSNPCLCDLKDFSWCKSLGQPYMKDQEVSSFLRC